MKNIALKQRRFLIVWICINAFALFVNIIPIKGTVRDENCSTNLGKELHLYANSSDIPYDSVIVNQSFVRGEIDLFTHGKDEIVDYNRAWYFTDKNNEINSFWPFMTKFKYCFYPRYTYFQAPGKGAYVENRNQTITGFLGIFNGYSYREFIVYAILGFAIVFLPKLWGKTERIESN